VSSATVVYNVGFPGKLCAVLVVQVNFRYKFACNFSIYVVVFIGSYMVCVKLCIETKTHTVIFSIYKTHTYNGKQYCRPWSTVSCACTMHTFRFYIRVINCVHMWLYTYIHLCNHNNFALCTNADTIVTNRFTTVPADVYHGKPHSAPWWTISNILHRSHILKPLILFMDSCKCNI